MNFSGEFVCSRFKLAVSFFYCFIHAFTWVICIWKLIFFVLVWPDLFVNSFFFDNISCFALYENQGFLYLSMEPCWFWLWFWFWFWFCFWNLWSLIGSRKFSFDSIYFERCLVFPKVFCFFANVFFRLIWNFFFLWILILILILMLMEFDRSPLIWFGVLYISIVSWYSRIDLAVLYLTSSVSIEVLIGITCFELILIL